MSNEQITHYPIPPPLHRRASAELTDTDERWRGGRGVRSLLRQLLRLRDGQLDRADHVERLLRQVVVLAVQDFAESAHRLLAGDIRPADAGEGFGDEHR